MSHIRLMSMLLLPLVCVVVWSAKLFDLQCMARQWQTSPNAWQSTWPVTASGGDGPKFGRRIRPNVRLGSARQRETIRPKFGTYY